MQEMLEQIENAKKIKTIYNSGNGWDLPLKVMPCKVSADVQAEWIVHAGNVVSSVACNLMWIACNSAEVHHFTPQEILNEFKGTHLVKSAEVYGYLDCGRKDEYSGVMYKIVIGESYTDHEAVISVVYNSVGGLQVKSVLVRENADRKHAVA